jgi:NitT/TauT family transport system permease protein
MVLATDAAAAKRMAVVWGPRLADPFFVSSPSLILSQLGDWAMSGALMRHVPITIEIAAAGFILGTVLGAAAGLACATVPALSRALVPLVTMGNSLPKLAFAPLLIGWFGLGMAPKLVLAAAVVFFFIFFGVYSGIRSIDRTILANARLMGAGWIDLLRHLYAPAGLSWVIAGLRLGLAYAFAAVIIGEYLGGNRGLGFLINYGKEMLDLTQVFAGLVVVVLIVGVLDSGLRHLERRGNRWRSALQQDIRT